MPDHTWVLRGGTVLDGTGGDPIRADVAIAHDRVAAVAPDLPDRGDRELDVSGLVVCPGFINMMSWACETLIEDGRSLSDIRQGVTLEVMGEGDSMGPLNPHMRERLARDGLTGGRPPYPVPWRSLAGYLEWLTARGVSPNVASFVGAGTLREHEAGLAERPLSPDELARMARLLDREMREGALGLASALIYPPETAYRTDELVALTRVVARYDGVYASHVRSEGSALLPALAELVEIAEATGARAEVYHLKAAGRAHWADLDPALGLLEAARARGARVTADAYPYTFSGTSLTACFPPWAHDGGRAELRARLIAPETRRRILADMHETGWENAYLDAGPDNIVVGSLPAGLDGHVGQSLSQIARRLGSTPAEAAMDLVVASDADVFALFHDIDERNLRRILTLPWVSLCSDAESLSAEQAQDGPMVHPRAFGAFARMLGHYVRDQSLVSLPEAVRRMTGLPAGNLGLRDRGRLAPGFAADIAVFDADRIGDRATQTEPHRYAVGMQHVFVNGVPVLLSGEHTGATPGRFVRGPGFTGG